MRITISSFFLTSIVVLSCNENGKKTNSFETMLASVKDTLHISNELDIVNIYKDQVAIYADYNRSKDTLELENDLKTLRQKYLDNWGPKGCFSWREQKFIEFNKSNVTERYNGIKERTSHLIENNVDSILREIFNEVSKFSGYEIKGRFYVYFFPEEWQELNMGGCGINTMQINLGNEGLSVDGIAQVFPHELNHQIYEISSAEDKNYGTVLWGIIDEGFATYFEKTFNDNDVLSSLNFAKEDYEWCLANELEIYEKAKPLFLSTEKVDEQKLNGNQGKYLIKGAPARLNYFMGYRIVERYVKLHGERSWKDVYNKPVMELLAESHYEEFLRSKD